MSILESRNDGLPNCRRLLLGVEIPTPSSMTSGADIFVNGRGIIATEEDSLDRRNIYKEMICSIETRIFEQVVSYVVMVCGSWYCAGQITFWFTNSLSVFVASSASLITFLVEFKAVKSQFLFSSKLSPRRSSSYTMVAIARSSGGSKTLSSSPGGKRHSVSTFVEHFLSFAKGGGRYGRERAWSARLGKTSLACPLLFIGIEREDGNLEVATDTADDDTDLFCLAACDIAFFP